MAKEEPMSDRRFRSLLEVKREYLPDLLKSQSDDEDLQKLAERAEKILREHLEKVAVADSGRDSDALHSEAPPRKTNSRAKSAPEYVAKMDYDPEKWPALSELAKRFQDKSFLPTFGDIRNFCQVYEIDVPASKSRASAIPRVFKCIATMDSGEIQRIVDNRLFSGPARLGPIADAIRKNGRAAAF